MYNMFPEHRRQVTINGSTKEKWTVNRLYGLNRPEWDNTEAKALAPNNTRAQNGDLVEFEGKKYFVISTVTSETKTKQIRLRKTNATINIVRLSPIYINGTKTNKYTKEILAENIPAYFRDLTEKMKMYDTGLLQTSTRKFIIPDIPGLQLLDRIELLNEFCQIDHINTTENYGLWTVQTQMDKRASDG